MKILNTEKFLGYEGESYSREIKFEVEDELKDCDIHFEFKKENSKSSYMSNKIDITKRYMLPYELLLEQGILKVQMVAYRGNDFIEKSEVKTFYVKESINAVDVLLNEEHYSFKGEINEKVEESFQKLSDDLGEVELSIKGTKVPNDGFVENIYFNTSLSVEEVKSIVNILPEESWLAMGEDLAAYVIFVESQENPDYPIIIHKHNNEYLIGDLLGASVYFTSEVFTDDSGKIYDIGWHVDDEPISINRIAISPIMGYEVGKYNNLLTSLISTTPFIEETLPENPIEQVAFKINKKINVLEEKIESGTSDGAISKKLVIDVAYSDLVFAPSGNMFNSNYKVDCTKFYHFSFVVKGSQYSTFGYALVQDGISGLMSNVPSADFPQFTLIQNESGYNIGVSNIDNPYDDDFTLKVYEM